MEIMEQNHKFHIENIGQLRSEIARLNLDIPVDSDITPLCTTINMGDRSVANRFCVQPMEGGDASGNGAPDKLTFRRYAKYAYGGFGIIWMEAVAVLQEARSNPRQLYLNKNNVAVFSELVKVIRTHSKEHTGIDPIIVIQLAHSGRYSRPNGALAPIIANHSSALDVMHDILPNTPLITDEYIDQLQNTYVALAQLAAVAGFDAVDVKCCHRDLIADLLAAFSRPGKYGGSFENRTRFLLETITRIQQAVPEVFVTTRMTAYNALRYPYGFGVDKNDINKPDLAEPIQLANMLQKAGVPIINVTTASLDIAKVSGYMSDISDDDITTDHEHPLETLARSINITRQIQEAVPNLAVVASGYSWLRQFIPNVASAVIKSGGASILGVGREALAYPEFIHDIIQDGGMDAEKCCITCGACIQLLRDGGNTGCVIKDSAIYGAEYRHRRHFALDNLREESRRCHNCEAASCTAACPARIDIPSFIKAFENDDIKTAYEVIRRSNVLPEMCSHLCPVWMQCEGACIENTLAGNPIPIKDIQYVICWLARSRGIVGTIVPEKSTGKTIAVIGAGPSGIACAIRLIEQGHNVVIYEKNIHSGGTPAALIRASRLPDTRGELDALLQPALQSERLEIKYQQELGKDISLAQLREKYDAVSLAAGLWQEISLGKSDGVIDAITFLRRAKNGEIKTVPERVAVLSGGDCAMDAASLAEELGATDLYVVYGGALSDMHWHQNDGWFKEPGRYCLTLCDPIGYEVNSNDRLEGLKICRMQPGVNSETGQRILVPISGSDFLLNVDMVIEAMGLEVADRLKTALKGIQLTDNGLIATTGSDNFATNLDRVFVTGALINGGASVVQCVAEGMKTAYEINKVLLDQ